MVRAAFCIACAVSWAWAAPQVTSGAFTVDSTPPAVPQHVAPASGAPLADFYVRLAATAQDSLSGVADYEFQLEGEAGIWSTTGYLVRRDLRGTSYQWRVRARDRAGNISQWSVLSPFTLNHSFSDDQDRDGVSDLWENEHFGGDILPYDDADRDGIPNIDEFNAQTHPFEFYLDLQRGWNMVALPFDATLDGIGDLRAAVDGPLYVWTGTGWEEKPLPLAHEGFWVFAAQPSFGVAITGNPIDRDYLALESGWNLAGSGQDSSVADTSLLSAALDWNGISYEELSLSDLRLRAFAAYWLNAESGGQLEFQVD